MGVFRVTARMRNLLNDYLPEEDRGRPLTFAVSGLRAFSFPRKPIPIRISL